MQPNRQFNHPLTHCISISVYHPRPGWNKAPHMRPLMSRKAASMPLLSMSNGATGQDQVDACIVCGGAPAGFAELWKPGIVSQPNCQ